MKRESNDEELMLAYAAGDASAFDLLYERHRGPLFRYLRRQLGGDPAVEELYQDIWIRVIGARDRYAPSAKFSTWLFTIAHNRLMDHFRAEGRKPEVELATSEDGEPEPIISSVADPGDRPEDMLERKRLAGRILEALALLPPPQREAFVLQHETDLTVEEIAEVTGVNRETAKSRLRYALNRLRQELLDLTRDH